jgi:putative N-acetylmannosamine-6-phosphate epimerase
MALPWMGLNGYTTNQSEMEEQNKVCISKCKQAEIKVVFLQ